MLVLDEWGRGGQHFSLRLVEAKGLTLKKTPKQIEVAEHNGQQRFLQCKIIHGLWFIADWP